MRIVKCQVLAIPASSSSTTPRLSKVLTVPVELDVPVHAPPMRFALHFAKWRNTVLLKGKGAASERQLRAHFTSLNLHFKIRGDLKL